MTVISNTTVIANFAALDQLDALRQLFGTVHISSEVYEEICRGLDEGYTFYSGIDQWVNVSDPQGWLRLTSTAGSAELATFVALPRRLHRGEASCLAIALHRKWLFMTDDAAARRQAREMGVRFSGTLGCLVLMVRRGLVGLHEANAWLAVMIERNYRSPVQQLDDLVAE